MIRTLKDTTSSDVDKELAKMREETGIRTLGRVLTLVIMADMGHSERAIEAAIAASHEHPCRIIVHISHDPKAANRLDAEASMGGDAGASDQVVSSRYYRSTSSAGQGFYSRPKSLSRKSSLLESW
ncbi:MAG: glucose-6-phosphate dehydrogenase assembly protein OpcA, partial [Kocuria sp.]|nr:glucose-6-phosphate dehydrogenase assembly protein OpcA [Kocuria sp.]